MLNIFPLKAPNTCQECKVRQLPHVAIQRRQLPQHAPVSATFGQVFVLTKARDQNADTTFSLHMQL